MNNDKILNIIGKFRQDLLDETLLHEKLTVRWQQERNELGRINRVLEKLQYKFKDEFEKEACRKTGGALNEI